MIRSRPAGLRLRSLAFALCTATSLSAVAVGSPKPQTFQVGKMVFDTHTLPSKARPAGTPGTPGVVVEAGSKLATQFGTTKIDLNKVRYTRYRIERKGEPHRRHLLRHDGKPDAIVVLVPGTLASSHSFLILAENVIERAWKDHRLDVEVWGVDRRSTQLQDMEGLNIAEHARDATIALNFLYGNELGLPLHPKLSRRAVFYEQRDLGFFGNWTAQVHSLDIDAVVERARQSARHGNVFLGGHSAGTGYAARYAATDFNLRGKGKPEPGYAKLRGLVLLEGQGGGLAATPPTQAQLDAVIAAADGGMAAAISAGTIAAYTSAPGLTPRVNASSEVTSMQAAFEGTINGSQALLQQDQGGIAGNRVYLRVPDFRDRAFPVTAAAALGTFMDDDVTPRTQFYSISHGALGPAREDGVRVWLDSDEPLPASAFRDFGPMYTTMSLPLAPWGREVEATRTKRLIPGFYLGDTTYSDWYYPGTGLLIGNAAGAGGANLGLDTSALSLPVAQGGRGRPDIVNQTQARKIDIPVIGFGGSNGLTPVPGVWRSFAEAIAPCAAKSCTPGVARTPSGQDPLAANRTYGGVAGGFEVHISEGYTHVDVLTAEDDATNQVVKPMADFVARNIVKR